jgi:hypothetical protein
MMTKALFRIHPVRGEWVVEEQAREIGGIFTTLVAALEFVAREARRFQGARAVIDLPS